MFSQTVTTIINKYVPKGKKILYLVLQKKTNERIIIENLERELDIKMQDFLRKISEKLINVKFDDAERSLKYILLKGLINILEKMIEENMGKLSEEDKKLIKDIMNEDNNQKHDNNEKDGKNNKPNKDPKIPENPEISKQNQPNGQENSGKIKPMEGKFP